jgi:hypothetical protein
LKKERIVHEPRRFRFGVQMVAAATAHEWKERAARAETLGYDVLVMPDHLERQFAIGPALGLAAEVNRDARLAE